MSADRGTAERAGAPRSESPEQTIRAAPATAFTPILRRAVEKVPGSIGAVFADWEGEAVDLYATTCRHELLLLAAHYGIILNHVQAVLHLFHFGEAVELVIEHERMSVLTRVVGDGYFFVLAVSPGVHLATAMREADTAVQALRLEM